MLRSHDRTNVEMGRFDVPSKVLLTLKSAKALTMRLLRYVWTTIHIPRGTDIQNSLVSLWRNLCAMLMCHGEELSTFPTIISVAEYFLSLRIQSKLLGIQATSSFIQITDVEFITEWWSQCTYYVVPRVQPGLTSGMDSTIQFAVSDQPSVIPKRAYRR